MTDWNPLKPDDVIHAEAPIELAGDVEMFTAAMLRKSLFQSFNPNKDEFLTDDGIPARVLDSEKGGWQTGRVRISVEFHPGEPAAPSEPE